MSNSDNPFSSPTVVAPEELPKGAKRGVAHIVRRAKLPSQGAHVIARNAAPSEFSDDSIDALITSPALSTPVKPEPTPPPALSPAGSQGAIGKAAQIHYGTGTVDDFTVEEAPQALVPIADEVAPADDPTRGFLMIRAGSDTGRRVGLLEGRTTIGRGLDCDVVLTDPSVSRQHAYVERRENVYVVCDLGSGNGTFVNERERDGEVLIVNSDSFRIGNTVVTFQGPEAQDEAASTTDWRAQASTGGGKKKGRSRQGTSDEESTVAGKGKGLRPPTDLPPEDLAPELMTHAATNVVPSVQVAPQKATRRKATVPPPIPVPESKRSVQDAALAAVSSIVSTPTPGALNRTGLGELPNQTVPPTPSPAIPYPVNPPSPFQAGMPDMRQQAQGHMPMRQGSQGHMPMGMPPGMAPGQMPMGPQPTDMPYSSPQGYMQQGSGPMMQRPMLAGARPDMRPYGHAQAPRENGKLLIGFISVTLVLVVVGLVATIMGQIDETKKVAVVAGADAGSGDGPELVPAVAGADNAKEADAGSPVADNAKEADAGSPVADNAKEADAGSPVADNAKEADAGETAVATAKSADADLVAVADPDEGKEPAEPLLVASLIANNTQMPVSTWGTDESFLRGVPDIKPTVEPIAPVVDPVVDPVVEEPVEEPVKPRNDKPRNDKPRNDKPRNDKPRNDKPRNDKPIKPRNDGDDDDDDDDDDPPKVASGDVQAAKNAAKAMYKRGDYEEAADRLADTAESLDDKTANKLLDIASGYRQVGSLMAAAVKEDPVAALKSYKKALTKDKMIGGAAHARIIRLRIGQVAPKAAKSYMAKKDYVEAKRAADDAKRYSEEEAVAAVYASLERKAESLVKKALKVKSKDPDEAKKLLRDVTKIAPKDTEVYEQARKELKEF